MDKAIQLMEQAFIQISKGQALIPLRISLKTEEKGQALFMPSYSPIYQLFGLKMVSVFHGNTSINLPVIQGEMMIMDGENGMPLAVMDAVYLTALRTGAASGLATRLLSRKDAAVLAIFGTGAQALTQVAGVLAVRKIKKVMVFSRKKTNSESFIQKMKAVYGDIFYSSPSIDELIHADIICTATPSHQPLFEYDHLKRGAHINAVGAYLPNMQEVGSSVMARARIVVDQRAAALEEAGDIIVPIKQGILKEELLTELGEIVSGRAPARQDENEITVFKSVGIAIQDLAIAHFMLRG